MGSIEDEKAMRKMDALIDKLSSSLDSIRRLQNEVRSGSWGDDLSLRSLNIAYLNVETATDAIDRVREDIRTITRIVF